MSERDDPARAILRTARELLADERAWCRYAAARDGAGEAVAPSSALARAWCLDGAIAAARQRLGSPAAAYGAALDRVYHVLARRGVSASMLTFNDDPATQHRDVIAVLDAAIAL